MSNMKIVAMVDAASKAQAIEIKQQFESDIQLAITLVEDEIIELRSELSELRDRVRKLEEGGVVTPASD